MIIGAAQTNPPERWAQLASGGKALVRALAALEKAIARDPPRAFEEIRPLLEEVLQQKPSRPELYYPLAGLLWDMADQAAAKAGLEKVVERLDSAASASLLAHFEAKPRSDAGAESVHRQVVELALELASSLEQGEVGRGIVRIEHVLTYYEANAAQVDQPRTGARLIELAARLTMLGQGAAGAAQARTLELARPLHAMGVRLQQQGEMFEGSVALLKAERAHEVNRHLRTLRFLESSPSEEAEASVLAAGIVLRSEWLTSLSAENIPVPPDLSTVLGQLGDLLTLVDLNHQLAGVQEMTKSACSGLESIVTQGTTLTPSHGPALGRLAWKVADSVAKAGFPARFAERLRSSGRFALQHHWMAGGEEVPAVLDRVRGEIQPAPQEELLRVAEVAQAALSYASGNRMALPDPASVVEPLETLASALQARMIRRSPANKRLWHLVQDARELAEEYRRTVPVSPQAETAQSSDARARAMLDALQIDQTRLN